MDSNECKTMIQSARSSSGKSKEEILAEFNEAVRNFGKTAREKFGNKGEW